MTFWEWWREELQQGLINKVRRSHQDCWNTAYRAGMERAAEVCCKEAEYCLNHYQDTHDTKWLNDGVVADKLEQAIRAELEGK